ncbi:MAG TPA: hypothetical protein ENH28_03595 [Euryarchaeota archaeon]|nr:hypothetical protein BMS3Bbin15_01653 [archaeon BMS3Bbin15]HDL15227.1 hypothetical protein [Euryarchaeota archaeon]
MKAEEELEYLESILEDDFFAKLDVATNLNYVVYLVVKEILVPRVMTREEFEAVTHREDKVHILDNVKAVVEQTMAWDYLVEVIETVKVLHLKALKSEEGISYREIEEALASVRKLVQEADRIADMG